MRRINIELHHHVSLTATSLKGTRTYSELRLTEASYTSIYNFLVKTKGDGGQTDLQRETECELVIEFVAVSQGH
jgi:hypothetical protein